MPLNYLQVKNQFPAFIETHKKDQIRRENLLSSALFLLQAAAEQPERVQGTILQTQRACPNLRCAGPGQELMSSHFPCPSIQPMPWQLIGVDGSQITPDLHSALPFGLINTGVFRMPWSGDTSPIQTCISTLIYQNPLDHSLHLPSEEEINFLRDLVEREVLVQQLTDSPNAAIALTDGPLAIFREPENTSPWMPRFDALIALTHQLPHPQRMMAGYVDQPRSNLVIEMLDLLLAKNQLPISREKLSTLAGLQDEDLFQGFLPAGSRSAVFVLHSRSAHFFQNDLAIHFFYLNVSQTDQPALVRIEIPAWVAYQEPLLNTLHQVLLDQCRILGSHPYPYILHRAHEVAVVHHEEKTQLEAMLIKQWLAAGLPLKTISPKQFMKNQV